jgi:hypothetical protein
MEQAVKCKETAFVGFIRKCFSTDTQLLAFDGQSFRFMGWKELSSIQHSAPHCPLLLASYDPAACELQYCPLAAPLFVQQGAHRMVDLHHCADSGRSSNHVSVSVTADHTLFLRQARQRRFHRRPASHLLEADDDDFDGAVHLLGNARNGVSSLSSLSCLSGCTPSLPCVSALGLNEQDELDAFLELYGYWLAVGRRDRNFAALCFHAADEEAGASIRSLFARLARVLPEVESRCFELEDCEEEEGRQAREQEAAQQQPPQPVRAYVVRDHRWLQYFSAEEGEEEATGSSRRLWRWLLRRLHREQLRLVLRGLWQAGGRGRRDDSQCVFASSPGLRDELMTLCLHAGYSAVFQLEQPDSGKLWSVAYCEGEAAEPELRRGRDVRQRQYTGLVWCVTVAPHHLVVARRVLALDADGAVNSASRPVIVGQCLKWEPKNRMTPEQGLQHEWITQQAAGAASLLIQQTAGAAIAAPAVSTASTAASSSSASSSSAASSHLPLHHSGNHAALHLPPTLGQAVAAAAAGAAAGGAAGSSHSQLPMPGKQATAPHQPHHHSERLGTAAASATSSSHRSPSSNHSSVASHPSLTLGSSTFPSPSSSGPPQHQTLSQALQSSASSSARSQRPSQNHSQIAPMQAAQVSGNAGSATATPTSSTAASSAASGQQRPLFPPIKTSTPHAAAAVPASSSSSSSSASSSLPSSSTHTPHTAGASSSSVSSSSLDSVVVQHAAKNSFTFSVHTSPTHTHS